MSAQVVNRGEAALQFLSEVPPTEVDILQGCMRAAMSGEERNFMNIPAGAGHIRQAQMAQSMCGKLQQASAFGDSFNDLGPGPD